MTLESSINALAAASTDLTAAVNVKKAVLDAATASASANANAATSANATAQTAQALAVAAAASATSARDAVTAAWSASTAPAESLAALAQSLHIGSIVRLLVYDTSRDPDGGAWRKRCGAASWYTESITGTWRGQRANEAACRAVPGATTGDYYQSTTDGQFYTLSAGSGQTSSLRGNAREFPARMAIVVEPGRVVLYDLTQPTCPMWMVIAGNSGGWDTSNVLWQGSLTAAAMHGAVLCVADSNSAGGGLTAINFAADTAVRYTVSSSYGGRYRGNLAQRNAGLGYYNNVPHGYGALLNSACNDVAMTVLPSAPLDVATGLPVPTIAMATAGGVSVVRDTGAMVNITIAANAAYSVATAVQIDRGRLFYAMDTTGSARYLRVDDLPTADVAHAAYNTKSNSAELYIAGTGNGTADIYLAPQSIAKQVFAGGAIGHSGGVAMLKRNPSAPAKSMVAHISNTYTSGWQVGDVRGCWLADTVAGATAATEPDRCAKNVPLTVTGTLTKSAVAAGAALMAYAGFAAGNYFSQASSANLDFGTGDFCIMFWAKLSIDTSFFYRGADLASVSPPNGFNIWSYPDTAIKTMIGGISLISAALAVPGQFNHIAVIRSSGVVSIWINGTLAGSVANTANLTQASAVTRIGTGYYNAPLAMALFRIGATAPSADQIAHIWRTEAQLFAPGAQCAIAGTSTAVTALAFDDATEQHHAATSWGRSAFSGLVRVDSDATKTGALTSVAAAGGVVVQGGTSARVYHPALLLRDELQRKAEARRALGKEPVFVEFDATAGQTAFAVPRGQTIKAVYLAGALQRLGATKQYTVSNDGFSETVIFAAAPGATAWVSIMTIRSS